MHQTTPACWLLRAGPLGGGCALMRTLRQGFQPQCLIGVDRARCKWLNLKSATKMFYRETVMPKAEQCNAYAAAASSSTGEWL